MKLKTIILILLTIAGVCTSASAQSLWLSGDFDWSITKQWGLDVGAEYRTTDGLKTSDRATLGLCVSYKPIKFLKFDAGYKYIRQHQVLETTRRGNIVPGYWYDRHRIYGGVTGKIKAGRFEISLRERYQFTRRMGKFVPKFASDGVTPKDDEWVSYKSKHILRSRIGAEYNIRKNPFTPFVNAEFYDDLSRGFVIEKMRFTAGTDYKINRHNVLEFFYRYVEPGPGGDSSDRANVIGIGYTFKL